MPTALVCVVSMLALAAGGAWAQTPPRPPAATPAPAQPALDPAQAAAKAAFEALAEDERKATQNDLIWTGDFNGVAGGEFGRRTYDALVAFERRTRGEPNGVLTPPERATLKRDADAARASLRFQAVTDTATGIRLGLPQALLTQRVAVDNGVVYRRPDGLVSLNLIRLPAAADFQAFFDEQRRDGPNRRVTYRLFRGDWFVLSGEEGARKFYTRLAQGPSGIRGYTFRYPGEQAAQFDRIMIAIANTFEPFPGTDVAANPARVATAPAASGAGPTPQPPAPRPTPDLQRPSISAAAVGPGRALTSRAAWEACPSPTLAGQPAQGQDVRGGEVMLVTSPAITGPGLALARAPAAAPVFALSREAGPGRAVMVSPGRWSEPDTVPAPAPPASALVTAALQLAAGGAPVLNAQGQLVGLVRTQPQRQRFVAGVAAEAAYAVIPAARFAEAAGFALQPPADPAKPPATAGIAAAGSSLVEIACGPLR